MWKKAVPTVALCSVLLVGCGNTDDTTVPSDNETPMEDVNNGYDVNTPSPGDNNDTFNNDNGNGTGGMGGTGTDNTGGMDGDNGSGLGNDGNDGGVNGSGKTINGTGDGVMDENTYIKEPRVNSGDSNQ